MKKLIYISLACVLALVAWALSLYTGDAELSIFAATILPSSVTRAQYLHFLEYLNEMYGEREWLINRAGLRMEAVLSANVNRLEFYPVENVNSDRKTEVKLSKNERYMITRIALAITKYDATNDAKFANYPLFTYPNGNFFVGKDGSGNLEYEALETLYNGVLKLETGSQVHVDNLLTSNLRFVGEKTFETAAVTGESNPEFPSFGPGDAERGFFDLMPWPIIDGGDDNTFELNIGEGDRTLIAGGVNFANASVDTANVAVLLTDGFLVSGTASGQRMVR